MTAAAPQAGPVEAWLAARSERVIETSCARVYFQGERTLKIKKPVDYGFLDFSSLPKREWAIRRELAFNRAAAPDIYRAVLPIRRTPDGDLMLGGETGEVVEWALEMRRFDDSQVLSNQPEAVAGDLAEALGRVVARAHRDATITDAGGQPSLKYNTGSDAERQRLAAGTLGAEAVERLIAGAAAALAAQTPLLEARRLGGFVRTCHGDLHLGNILLEAGRPVLFDCIEFNDRMREIDILYDLAFLLMDLDFRGRAAAANRVFNAWLDETARFLPPQTWDGLAALPLMLSVRAGVRAHVRASEGEDGGGEARAYLAAALRHLEAPAPRLLAVGGLSGSGKTTWARAIAPGLGGAPGAVILRSDEIRKRLWGRAPTERLPPEAYAAGEHARVYGEMFAVTRRVLAAGRSVVLDAAFLAPQEREEAARVGDDAGVALEGVWLEGDPVTLRERLAARRGDASDADVAVLESQMTRDLGEITWRRARGG